MFVVESVFNAIDEFSDGAWCEVELRGGLLYDFGDEFVSIFVRVLLFSNEIAAVDLEEHLAFVMSHGREWFSCGHG